MGRPAQAEERRVPDIVRIDGVSKRFVLRRDNSLKERLITLGRLGRKHREEFWALKDVDLTIAAGTTVGLIGHNGSGKSTLLKVVGGIIDPTLGAVRRRGRIAALLELGAGFHPDLTGRENVFLNASILGLSRAETEDQLDDILAFASIGDFIDTQVKFYSSGMYVRLAFAVAVHTDPDLLLVDEVLSVGDEAFQRKCMDKIRSFQTEGRTIVLVTHSLDQVIELCDRAVLLNEGEVVFDGVPRDAVRQFRDILEDRRLDEVGPVTETAAGDAPAGRVLAASAHASGRSPDQMVGRGDDLQVDVTLEHPPTLTDWMIAIQVNNVMGQVVYATTTKRMGIELPPLAGTFHSSFLLRDTTFGSGKYFVNVSLMLLNGVHLHDLPQACSFDVPDYPLAVGMMYADPEFSYDAPVERRAR